MSDLQIPRPTSGDVLERILDDHRLFEDLLREARRTDTDRVRTRAALAEALLALLRVDDPASDDYDEALEELATVVNHHSNEEEQTILNPAREEISLDRREALGVDWLTRRNLLLADGCGSAEQVAALVGRAEADGTLDDT